uniref:Uncharacterized protein n=1 Tax=Arundo donax TaxID=35708 RepID=A0A0A9AFY8_ARUDO
MKTLATNSVHHIYSISLLNAFQISGQFKTINYKSTMVLCWDFLVTLGGSQLYFEQNNLSVRTTYHLD